MSAFSASDPSPDVLKFLEARRSPLAKLGFEAGDAGPDDQDIVQIISRAARVPDHRKLGPWRFIVINGETRAQLGQTLKTRYAAMHPNANAAALDMEAARLTRAPYIVAVVSSPVECVRGTPQWEQEMSSGAVCFQMLLVARAMGFAAQWLTEWYAYDRGFLSEIGVTTDEKIAGYIYIGAAEQNLSERPRPDIAQRLTWL